MEKEKDVAGAIRATLESVNETDSNFESANVVDGLFAISRSINRLARSIELLSFADDSRAIDGTPIIVDANSTPLSRIAKALEILAKKKES